MRRQPETRSSLWTRPTCVLFVLSREKQKTVKAGGPRSAAPPAVSVPDPSVKAAAELRAAEAEQRLDKHR